MNDIERQVLQQNHVDILRNLKLDSDILGALFEKGILTEHMVQVVQSRPTDQDKINELLQLLPKRGPEAYNCFLDAIRVHSSWLADKLHQSHQRLTEEAETSSAEKTSSVTTSATSDKILTPRNHQLHNSHEELRKSTRTGENKIDSPGRSAKDSAHLPVPKEIVYHDPGVQRNLNHLMAKIKMKLSSKNLREISFSSPEPATFGVIERLLDQVFDCLELLETTVARSYTFLGARDKDRNLESYIIDLMDKKRKLETENREREHQKNKLYQHISKLENMCRNQKTTQEHLNTELGRLRENSTKTQAENEEKQKTIDDLRKLIVELEQPRKGRSRFSTWKVQNENKTDEIVKLQKENKGLKTENEQLKSQLAHSLIQIKSDNLKQLAKMREESHEQDNTATDNEHEVKTKISPHSSIKFSESSQNMQVRGHLHHLYGQYNPDSTDHDGHHTHGKDSEYSRDISPSAKGDKRVRFSDYSPTRYYHHRQPLVDSTSVTDHLVNGYDSSHKHSPIRIPTGRHEVEETKQKDDNEKTETAENNKSGDKTNSRSQRSRFVKSIGRSRSRRSVSLNNMNSSRDPNKMTTQLIKKTKIINS